MSNSIVKQLIVKDLQIMKVPCAFWFALGIVAVAVAILGDPSGGIVTIILFVTAMAGAGIHSVMQTVVEERTQQTLAFIMSLPVDVRGYTSAKLAANLCIFLAVWLPLSVICYVVAFLGDDGMPDGTIPFVTILLVAIFLGYVAILSTSLVTESIGMSIFAIVATNLLIQVFMWWVSDLHGIRSAIGGPVADWNTTAVTIVASQIVAIGLLLFGTYFLQSRKTDFI